MNTTFKTIRSFLGSGKTHTINGIILKTIDFIFEHLNENMSVGITMFELYNGKIFDLLDRSKEKKLSTGEHIEDFAKLKAASSKDLNIIWSNGISQRKTSPTLGNINSSRSHAFTQFEITYKNNDQQAFTSKINFVDLAGTESASSSANIEETKFINSSLSALTTVVMNLRKKLPSIDFTQNILTKMLKPSLIGDSKTVLFTNISSSIENIDSSLSSLRFAASMGNLPSGK